MAALFSPRDTRRFRVALLAGLLSPLIIVGALMAWVRRPAATGQNRDIRQPIPFDHRLHGPRLGMDCRFCHAGAERSASAGVPPTETCLPCHNPLWLGSSIFAPVRQSLSGHRPIPWIRVHRLPDFVFFDHSIHVTRGIACGECHGQVDSMAVVRQVAPLTMGWCLECHRQSPAAPRLTHCTVCHR